MEEQNRGDGSCRVSGRAPGAGCRRAMVGRSKDDFSLDSPFIEQLIWQTLNLSTPDLVAVEVISRDGPYPICIERRRL